MELLDIIEGTIEQLDDEDFPTLIYERRTARIKEGGIFTSLKQMSTGREWIGIADTHEAANAQLPSLESIEETDTN